MAEAGAGALLQVDLGAIVANWRLLCTRHRSGAVAGVVKANAYGLGAARVAQALLAAGCRHFFTATLDEALALRPHLRRESEGGAMLAVLSGLTPGTEALYRAQGLVPVLGAAEEIALWRKFARESGEAQPAILHVDTGMARLGLTPTEVAGLAGDPTQLAGIALRYVMTHLVAAEIAADPMNQRQRQRFAAACAALPAAARSFANSSGIFLGADFASDLARPGAALYGINPTPDAANPMRRTVRLIARVQQVRTIPAGTPVGYNATWTAARESRIATVALGYADGWHRSRAGTTLAFFDGRAVPLVGRISMDLTTFDVTEHPAIIPGTWLELLGKGRDPDAVAAASGSNGYEVLTSLAPRIQRQYLDQ